MWLTETPDSPADLATSIVVGPFGEHTREIRVFDYDQVIVSVRRATADDGLDWRPSNPKRDGIIEVARGPTDRQVGIRWRGGACDPDWQVLVSLDPRNGDVWVQARTFGDFCPGEEPVTRSLVVTFDRPVDLDRMRSSDGSCCG